MLTDRMEGISTVEEEVAMDEKMGKEDRVGELDLLGDRVCLGYQNMVYLVVNRWEVHLGVATLEGKVAEDEGQEDRVVVEVSKGEFMMCNEWTFKRKERTEERRWRGGVSYSPLRQTLHISASAQLLYLGVFFCQVPRSGTCMLMECHSGIESS